MHIYLENKALFVQGAENRFYKVESVKMWDGYSVAKIELVALCGIAADGNLYAPTEENIDEWEEEANWYFVAESVKEALEAQDFTILEELPTEVKSYMRGLI